MKKLISLIILGVSCAMGFAQYQNDPLKIPAYVPSSPEVAGFAKYGDIPVSEYTGTPNISIPIHVVKSGTLSLPIELSYHPSGIQVGQEATWVGLGWNLIAGGTITYTPVGGNEQINGLEIPWTDRKALLDYVGNGEPGVKEEDHNILTGDDYCGAQSAEWNFSVHFNTLYEGLQGHGQPDLYSVNFLNYSFKFFMHPKDNTPVFVGKTNKCKIEKLANIFIIIGEDGVKYLFSKFERDEGNGYPTITAWYLTQITSPNGHTIKLTYRGYGRLNSMCSFSERIVTNYPIDISYDRRRRDLNNNHSTYNLYLDSIITDNEIVLFDLESREDLQGDAKRLKSIRVTDKLTNKDIINYSLSYDYFVGTNIGGDYTTDDNNTNFAVADNILRKRLKLNKLTKYGVNLSKGEEYSFGYNESVNLPLKTSFARDLWGYYNGQENSSTMMPNGAKHTMIPNVRDLTLLSTSAFSVPEEFQQYIGANRGTSAAYITAWMLTSIRYPTGGKTEFQYEPHTFTNLTYLSAEDNNNVFTPQLASVWSCNNVTSVTSQRFMVNKKTLVHFNGMINGNGNTQTYSFLQMKGASIVIMGPLETTTQSKTYHLIDSDGAAFLQNGSKKFWDETFYLEAGTYILGCSAPSVGDQGYTQLVNGKVTFLNFNASALANAIPIGGGVRVNAITNYDENNKVVLTKKYTYTRGKILVPLQFLGKRLLWSSTKEISYTLSSDSYVPSCPFAGTNVGYDKVEVATLSGSNTNGKEIVCYQNVPAIRSVADLPIYDYNYTNGDELKRIYLNAANDTVQKVTNQYTTNTTYREVINYIAQDSYIGAFDKCSFPRCNIAAYPNVNIWSYLKSKETTDYFNGNKVTKTTEFSYNANNYCVSEQKETNSDNKVSYFRFTYPVDYTAEPYPTMKGLNIISPVIEQSEYTGSNFLQSSLTSYSPWGTNALGYAFYKPNTIDTKANSTSNYETRIVFDSYDNLGNVLQYHKTNDVNTSFIWGYNQTYPVVKIEGKAYTDIPQAIKDAILIHTFSGKTDYVSIKADRDYINTQLSSLFADHTCMVTFYTYSVLLGMTSQTDPNGVTTYYEYDTFGRLQYARDDDGRILKSYEYHYKP